MRATRPIRLARAFVGASLTLLTMALLAPESAGAASCDHPAERPSVGLEASRLDGSPEGVPQAPRPKPCSGPSCSNKSAPAPTSASGPQPPPRAELWGLIGEPLPVARLACSARVADGELERPIRLATPVFHPPR